MPKYKVKIKLVEYREAVVELNSVAEADKWASDATEYELWESTEFAGNEPAEVVSVTQEYIVEISRDYKYVVNALSMDEAYDKVHNQNDVLEEKITYETTNDIYKKEMK